MAESSRWLFKWPEYESGNFTGSAWHRTIPYPQYKTFMPWTVLRAEAEAAWHWVSEQPGAWTQGGATSNNGACLVSALFVPRPDGGAIYFSTIGRGERAHHIMQLRNPREWAPAWLAANGGQPSAIHCEDGSLFDFEQKNNTLEDGDPNKVRLHVNPHIPSAEGRFHMYLPQEAGTGKQLRVQIAIFGAKMGVHNYVGLHLPCGAGDPYSNPKTPSCETVLRRLGVRVCTNELVQQEREQLEAQHGAGAAGAAGGAGGYHQGGASGHGAAPGHGYGHQPPQGGSNTGFFPNAGGSNTATHPHDDLSHRMAGLSMGSGAGSSSSNDAHAALREIGQGANDKYGHPVYYTLIYDKKTKTSSAHPVSVDIYGQTIGGKHYFCFNSDGNAMSEPPAVWDTDKDRQRLARGEKLYKLAKKLYSGKMAAAQAPQTHHDTHTQQSASGHAAYGHTTTGTYRPSTASSGGSGEYTTRPGSRDGTGTNPAGYSSVPRTSTPQGQNRTQTPVSQSGPSQPPAAASSSSTAPVPKKVKFDGKSMSKSKPYFNVHGIKEGRPYLKGVNGERDTKYYELVWSEKNGKFYISTGQERKDRIYLKEVRA